MKPPVTKLLSTVPSSASFDVLTAATSTDIHNTPVRNCDTPETKGETALSCLRSSS